MVLILYALLTTALYYLGARALLTEQLWSLYPPRFDSFMKCPACSGAWYGGAVALAFRLDVLGLPGHAWYTPFAVGFCASVWTPIVWHQMEKALVADAEG